MHFRHFLNAKAARPELIFFHHKKEVFPVLIDREVLDGSVGLFDKELFIHRVQFLPLDVFVLHYPELIFERELEGDDVFFLNVCSELLKLLPAGLPRLLLVVAEYLQQLHVAFLLRHIT